jgi:hypothetical protein
MPKPARSTRRNPVLDSPVYNGGGPYGHSIENDFSTAGLPQPADGIIEAEVNPSIPLPKGWRAMKPWARIPTHGYMPKRSSLRKELPHSHVFKSDWQGPFTVVAQKFTSDSDVYIIRDKVTTREWTVNSHKLKKFRERQFLRTL